MAAGQPLTGRDAAALILAAGIGVTVVVVAIRGTRQPADSSAVFELLALVLGAAVGAVATYLGTRNGGGK
jgi:hypothetical protein